jgi:hypothetical protein
MELATAITVQEVTATAALALPIAKQEVTAEVGVMLAAVEVQVKVLAWLDPYPSSLYPGQVLYEILMQSDLTLGRFCLLWGRRC